VHRGGVAVDLAEELGVNELTVPGTASFVGAPDAGVASVDVVVPVHNEERALPGSIDSLHAYLSTSFPFPWRITIVDNGSTDGTLDAAQDLATRYPGVHVVHLDGAGRGRALRTGWTTSPADIVAYMDVDLSTGLDALLPLVAPLVSGHSDIAIGSRLCPGARTVRGPKREAISRCYNFLLRTLFRVRFRDAQCGFKAMRADVARALVPAVRDEQWFFDTELLLLAEHNRLRIHEVPVDWVEDVDSRVRITRTALDDLEGIVRVARAKATNRADIDVPRRAAPAPVHPDAIVATRRTRLLWQVLSFAAIGVASTALHACIYLVLRQWWSAVAANLVALSLATLANTEANRRLTFNVRDRVLRRHGRAVFLFVLYYALTSGSVAVLARVVPDPPRVLEAGVIFGASLTATVLRFILLRSWVFRAAPGHWSALAVAPASEPPHLADDGHRVAAADGHQRAAR
jgi:putative flippase GtrA